MVRILRVCGGYAGRGLRPREPVRGAQQVALWPVLKVLKAALSWAGRGPSRAQHAFFAALSLPLLRVHSQHFGAEVDHGATPPPRDKKGRVSKEESHGRATAGAKGAWPACNPMEA